jgi:DNA polymerase V
MDHIYACIDLKSFYASVECVERNLNPLTTNLVVADLSRTEKTICLAVTPSLKQYGLSGRSRLYEVVSKVKEINRKRKILAKGVFIGKSSDDIELSNNPKLELDYIVAPPRMKYYMKYSAQIYDVYLKWFSQEDIYVYSIDEVFIDVSKYLKSYNLRASELITKVVQDVYETTGITATAGLGTNLYLAKIAMDIVAKHVKPNENGVRIAGLDEKRYRQMLWTHEPITDFWRVGKGYKEKLNKNGIFTMGDVAKVSIKNEELLYKLFGINAELLIDHAWGYEPCTIKDAKSYRPKSSSLSRGQVLHVPYSAKDAKLITKEMMDSLILDLVRGHLLTNQITLTINYDIKSMEDYKGDTIVDYYGRVVPKYSHGTGNLDHYTSSTKIITDKISKVYDEIVNPDLKIRKLTVAVYNLIYEDDSNKDLVRKQLDIFTSEEDEIKSEVNEETEKNVQEAIIKIQNKFGKNSILKGMNLEKKSTAIRRNSEVGGHKG